MYGLCRRELCKMFVPDPANLFGGIVLVSGEPKFALLSNHVKDFSSDVGKVRVASFSSRAVNIELVDAGRQEQDFNLFPQSLKTCWRLSYRRV